MLTQHGRGSQQHVAQGRHGGSQHHQIGVRQQIRQRRMAQMQRGGQRLTRQVALIHTTRAHVFNDGGVACPQSDFMAGTGLSGQRRSPSASTKDEQLH